MNKSMLNPSFYHFQLNWSSLEIILFIFNICFTYGYYSNSINYYTFSHFRSFLIFEIKWNKFTKCIKSLQAIILPIQWVSQLYGKCGPQAFRDRSTARILSSSHNLKVVNACCFYMQAGVAQNEARGAREDTSASLARATSLQSRLAPCQFLYITLLESPCPGVIFSPDCHGAAGSSRSSHSSFILSGCWW